MEEPMVRLTQSLRLFYNDLCSRIEVSAARHEAEAARLRAELAKRPKERVETAP